MDSSRGDNLKIERYPPGSYIDDWSTFRVPTNEMVLAWRLHSRWKSTYDILTSLQNLTQDLYEELPEQTAEAIDHAYYMMRKWEERSRRYLDENGGVLSMASGVPRNIGDFVDV